jgi:beta-lactam-binding protein with PASTA domain
MKGKPSQQFTPPSGKIVEGDQRSIPDVKCKTIEDARSRLRSAGFEVFVDPIPVNSTCPAGTAADAAASACL